MRGCATWKILAEILVVLLLTAAGVRAQTGTTSVRGSVTDKTGATIAGAKVTLISVGRALQRQTKTSDAGEYEFPALPPGTYALTIESPGFRKLEQENLQLLVGSPTTFNASLQVGAATETIQVTAGAATLNTTDATLGIAFGENQIKQLPLDGRNVPDLLTLQAGVAYTGNREDVNTATYDTRSGAVNGARSDQANITVDGVPVNDEGGYAFTSVLPVTLDSVQEFRVTTTNYNADQGSSSGAQVALVTKSGTNHFHGSVYEYHRNTATSANDFFVKSAEIQSNQPNTPPKLIRNVFGASVGGPILKDRLFFFLNYEGTRRAEEQRVTQEVPTASTRDGILMYHCDPNDPNLAADCPGGTVRGSSGTSYAINPGYFGLSPSQITKMDPLHLGPNSVVTDYMKTFPLPNNTTVGDGLNYAGFTFRSPLSNTKNWYIGRVDYNITRDGKHRLSVSGSVANEGLTGAEILPGQPSQTTVNFNKGFIANYVAVLSEHLINDLRYGYIRESSGVLGTNIFSSQAVNQFPDMYPGSSATPRTYSFQRPIHNLADDLSWIRGKHTLQFGPSIAFIREPRTSYVNSFVEGYTCPECLQNGGFAGVSTSQLNPPNSGYPGVDPAISFAQYNQPMAGLLGMVSEFSVTYNYKRDGTTQPQGAPVARRFALDSYEFYGQDTWKIKSNLTVVYGLRWSLFSPPWETNGLQVSPTFSLGQWFKQRAADMQNMIPSSADAPVVFDWSGPANGKPGYWNWDHKDFGPRLALAWSPKSNNGLLRRLLGDGNKTSIRAGFGMVYDRFGQGIVDSFDENGSFGLSTYFQTPVGALTESSAPRMASVTAVPTTDNNGNATIPLAPVSNFPQQYPSGTGAYGWGMDSSMRTPYSYALDFSVGRELAAGFSLQASYVGRLSRHLLAVQNLAEPLDLRDKKTGLDYFTAVTALAKLYRSGTTDATFNNSMVSTAVAQYWQDVIQPVQAGGAYQLGSSGGCGSGGPASTTNPVLAAFDLFCGQKLTEVFALQYYLDPSGIPDANNPNQKYYTFTGKPYTFTNPQFNSLDAWQTIAGANYNALQVNLRHKMSHGVQFDFNYTFSKSIDTDSDAERTGILPGYGGLGGQIINAWKPNALRAVSDFDATNQENANWLVDLPFGRGRAFGGNAQRGLDAIIGGWQLSGLFRLTSGFPVGIFNGYNFPTDSFNSGYVVQVSPVQTGAFRVNSGPNAGNINLFANANEADFRNTFPGEVGQRNSLRGDGYFGVDLGLSKRWRMPWSENQALQFRWEVFNVSNSVRFDVRATNNSVEAYGTAFGNYTDLLTNPRTMQFALRYEF